MLKDVNVVAECVGLFWRRRLQVYRMAERSLISVNLEWTPKDADEYLCGTDKTQKD